jgi:hypothetical protein
MAGGRMIHGFAVLAYPAEYRNSGIMSFVVGPDDVVYQKDLGEKTAELAAAISEFNPGDGWSPVNESSPSSASRHAEDESPRAHEARKH